MSSFNPILILSYPNVWGSSVYFRRRNSAPCILENDDDDFVLVYEDFTAAMTEVGKAYNCCLPDK